MGFESASEFLVAGSWQTFHNWESDLGVLNPQK